MQCLERALTLALFFVTRHGRRKSLWLSPICMTSFAYKAPQTSANVIPPFSNFYQLVSEICSSALLQHTDTRLIRISEEKLVIFNSNFASLTAETWSVRQAH